MTWDFAADMAHFERLNIAAGKCPKCAGDGVVANLAAITRTGNPYIDKRCSHCRGTGKPTKADLLAALSGEK